MATPRLADVVQLAPNVWKVEDGKRLHLVRRDRYGTYCEVADHGGRECPAVQDVKAYEQEKRK